MAYSIKETWARLKDRLEEMPWFLRIVALANVSLGIVCGFSPLMPRAHFQINGADLNWNQLWETKMAFAFFIEAFVMFAIGMGIFRRDRWVRPKPDTAGEFD